MKIKPLLPLLISIILILMLVATSCAPAQQTTITKTVTVTPTTAAPTTTASAAVVKDKTYKVLDPRGEELPVEIKPLAKRLDTLDGKTIYINQGEADPVIMPALYKIVQEKYPKTTWKYIATSGFGPAALEAEVTQNAKAVMRGISW
jgi:hypothetical protein